MEMRIRRLSLLLLRRRRYQVRLEMRRTSGRRGQLEHKGLRMRVLDRKAEVLQVRGQPRSKET